MQRELWNDNWIFFEDGTPESVITLPHDPVIKTGRKKDALSGNAGAYYNTSNYRYQKVLYFSTSDPNSQYLLYFTMIQGNARIYCNKALVTVNHYGYIGFYANLTPHLKEGRNIIEVRVIHAPSPSARWYTGAGITGNVYLYRGTDVHIRPDGLRITTPEADEEIAEVRIHAQILNAGIKKRSVILHTVLHNTQGSKVCEETSPVTLSEGSSITSVRQHLYITSPELWDIWHPALYFCDIEIIENGQVIERTKDTFGIRKIRFDPVHGLRINGKEVLLRGACIHEDNGMLGAAEYQEAAMRKIQILKEEGFNAIRPAHGPATPEIIFACDHLGMLIMEETFDQWNLEKTPYDFSLYFQQDWEKVILNTICKDFNHPSILMYCIGNEINEIGGEDGAIWSRKLTEKIHSLDDTRPVTNAINGMHAAQDRLMEIAIELGLVSEEEAASYSEDADINALMARFTVDMDKINAHRIIGERIEECCSILDIVGYNYMRSRYSIDAQAHPNWILFGSETMPPEIDLNWAEVESIPQCIGDFTWTGWDYLGEAGIGMTCYNNFADFGDIFPMFTGYCGDIDLIGNRLPAGYFRQIVWGFRKRPYICVQDPKHFSDLALSTPWVAPETIESWTWPGQEGNAVRIKVYSDADEVELFLNQISVDRKKVGKDNRYQAVFETLYEPGELTAVCYRNGHACEKETLQTVKSASQLTILRDMRGNVEGESLLFLHVYAVDDKGRIDSCNTDKINVQISEGGELLGMGNGDPRSTDRFGKHSGHLYRGKLLMCIRIDPKCKTPVRVQINSKLACPDFVI